MANQITAKALEAQRRGTKGWLTDGGSRGAGRLIAKDAKFYFSYFNVERTRRFLPIGPYDDKGARGLTLQQARDKAAQLSMLYRSGVQDLHGHFERVREAEERAQAAEEAARKRSEEEAQRSTLRQLLEAYSAHLERAGKQSAADAAGIFKLHVLDVAPDLVARRAADATVDDFVPLIARLVDKGKGRTAAKLRSYLRAAYSLALKAKTDPSAPLTLRTFGVAVNPLASIDALSKFNRARERHLSADEMMAFLRRLEAVPQSVKKDALSLCLTLGGQRPAQLVRAAPGDVDLSAETVTLYDGKGSRKQPRKHVLPLTKKPLAIARRLLESLPEDGVLIFTNDGKRGLRPETIAELVAEISAAMVKAKESRTAFELRDIRRTCETMLASLGVSKDIRAQLQSHGLGGIQDRHYDMHEYMLEKRATLEKWGRHLDALAAGKTAKVTQIRRATA